MKSFEIEDIKEYMNTLFAGNKFDSYYLYEARVKTALDYYISGKINPAFYEMDDTDNDIDNEDKAYVSESQGEFILWKDVKHTIYDLIKGERLPLNIKIILMFNRDNVCKLIEMNNLPLSAENVGALSYNIYYDNKILSVTTGTSLNLFTLDKSLEHLWDETVEKYYV